MSSTTDKQIPQSVQASNDKQRKYGAFQNEVYRAGMFHNRLPVVTTDPNKLEEQAKSILKPTAFNYVAGGAGERATMDANRLAFRQWKLVPRMLRATSQRDLSVKLFGETYETPVLMAPVGVQSIFHEDKETGLSEVCASIGIPYILSTASTSSIEEVAQASGTGPRWFQLYWPQTDAYTISLLNRAKTNGFKVLVVTLDTWALAWRPADLDHAYVPFFKGIGNKIGWGDPVFRAQFRDKYGVAPEENIVLASQEWIGDVFSGAAHSWEDIALLKKHWDGPIVLKGIQLDGAVASLEMLPEIVEAVGDKLTVLFDSGIRTGVDIIKALSLGAKAVLVGRPAIYGLAVGGKQGAKQVLQGILADLDQSMGISGIKDIGGCDMSMVRRCEYAGDVKSSN
ncbi:putative lactate 2-monooxygenase [Lachnellula arida]|uniref:Putative lactate 2-monooxygenase n=1 Tax=Lachnellula arida TaxID=1316785 RepID=A0A8T9BRD7_9HELO|nr:putative lactate 2-monooxygenase [Lachnellula arida]